MAWDLLVDRSDHTRTSLVETAAADLAPGQVRLRVDRVGMSANNVTYAVLGDLLRYWEFFPATEGWGRVPLWGFCEVEESTVAELVPGARFFGYLPTSSHLVVEPERVGAKGFRDGAAHRRSLPPVYNRLTATAGDPSYEPGREDLLAVYRPLFMTSFVLADFLLDNAFFGAQAVVLSSASSRTAYGTAYLLEGVHRVGLTSPGNAAFVRSLGCYDEVVTYDDLRLPSSPAVYVDVAGDQVLRRRVHEAVPLVHSAVVGAAHHDAAPDPSAEGLPGPQPAFFFAPDQVRKRSAEWGPEGVDAAHAKAWERFAPWLESWVEVRTGSGPEGLREAWLAALAGREDPRVARVVAL